MSPNPEAFRRAMGRFATGVTVITIPEDEDRVHGMTANAVTSVSLDPLLVLVCIDHRAHTLALLQQRKQFGINILTEEQETLSRYYARPDRDHQGALRLGVRYRYTQRGTPMLEECLAWLDCRVVATHEAGDHTIFIGQVEELFVGEGRPLLFYGGRYRRLDADVS